MPAIVVQFVSPEPRTGSGLIISAALTVTPLGPLAILTLSKALNAEFCVPTALSV